MMQKFKNEGKGSGGFLGKLAVNLNIAKSNISIDG